MTEREFELEQRIEMRELHIRQLINEKAALAAEVTDANQGYARLAGKLTVMADRAVTAESSVKAMNDEMNDWAMVADGTMHDPRCGETGRLCLRCQLQAALAICVACEIHNTCGSDHGRIHSCRQETGEKTPDGR